MSLTNWRRHVRRVGRDLGVPAGARVPLFGALAVAGGLSLFSRLANGSWNPLVMLKPKAPPSSPLPAPVPTPTPTGQATMLVLYDLSALRASGFGPTSPPKTLHVRLRAADAKGDTEDDDFSFDVVGVSADGSQATLRNSLDGDPLAAIFDVPPMGLFTAHGLEHAPTNADFPPPLNFGGGLTS